MDQTKQDPTIFDTFIEKLKAEKSEEEVGETLAALFEFQTEAIIEVIGYVLTEEDMQVIDKITDETQAENEILKRFQERAGMPLQDFVDKLRDSLASTYVNKDTIPSK